jgi:tetratricopeptide (TPR) repeat protein
MLDSRLLTPPYVLHLLDWVVWGKSCLAAPVYLSNINRKSQIAIEYSYKVRDKSPKTWVFWVNAGTVTRFEQDYGKIAKILKLPGRDDPKVDILKLVADWLQNELNGPWLLVLDNADDKTMFLTMDTEVVQDNEETIRPSLLTYIPQTRTGQILVTSRTLEVAQILVGDRKHIIPINSMEVGDAVALIKKKLAPALLVSDACPLLEALDYIPLARTQAAAYISMKYPIMTIPKYLDLFRASEINQVKLLGEKRLGDLRRDPNVPNAVIATWRISFNQIQEQNPEAADLMSLMSILNRQGIPESLLLQYNSDELALSNALGTLLAYYLIKPEMEGKKFDLHRLVQLATKVWLEDSGKKDKWIKEALRLIMKAFPGDRHENWAVWQLLLPHVEAVTAYDLQAADDLLTKAYILHNLASYLWLKGDYQLSKLKIGQAVKIKKGYLDEENPSLLASINLYATVLSSQGQYEKAEQMYRQTIMLEAKALGLEHPDTLTTMDNLATVLSDQGKCEEAEQMHRQTLKLYEKVLGLEHPDTLLSMSNLGLVLSNQGKYEEAEQTDRETLKLREKVLGLEHPDTLKSMYNLGLVLSMQGKYEEAEQMHRQTLKLEEVLGLEHPSTLKSMNSLATELSGQGKYKEAEQMYRQTLKLMKEVLGLEHLDTIMSMNSLGSVLSMQGKYEEAEQMHRQTLKLREKVLGLEHPNTLNSVYNLAYLFQSRGQYDDALIFYQRACLGYKKVLGPNHPTTQASCYGTP